MAYTNNSGGVRIGVRSPGSAIVTASTLLTSLYSVWNADTTTSTLDSSIYGAWNGETSTAVTTLNNNVKSVWNGDNFNDSSSNALTGSNVGTVTLSTGKIGNAFTFNGSNYVSIPSSVMNFTGDFTVNFWIKINSTAVSNQGIMGNKRWDLGPGGFEIIFNNGWLQALAGNQNNGSAGFATNGNLTLADATTWTMVTFIYRKGVSNSFYINAGTAYTTAHQHTLLTSSFNGQLGAEPMDNYRLNGNLDAVTFWDREITQNEIYSLYNSTNGREYPYPSTISVDIPSPNDAVSTNHGTLMNGCTLTTGKVGQSFTFNSTNAYVSLPDNSMNLTGDFTISVWVYPTAGTPQSIINNQAYANGSIYKGWGLDINNISGGQSGKVTFTFGQGPSAGAYTGWEFRTTSLTNNAWNHIIIQRVSGVNTYCWVNGISQTYVLYGYNSNITTNPTYHTTQYNTIGSSKQLSGVVSNYIANGSKVDGLTIWNKSLTEDERTQLYNSGTGTQYPFSGQTLPSFNNQFAIDNGTSPSGSAPTFTDGKIGKAFTFDGINDYIALPDNSLNSLTGDFTISMWVYLNGTVGGTMMCPISSIRRDSGNYYGVATYFHSGVAWLQIMRGGATNEINLKASSNPLLVNTWNHVVFTHNSSGSKIYINNTVRTSNTSSLNAVFHPSLNYCSIGANQQTPTYQYWFTNGSKIDGLSVWQKELTQTEITELYNSGNGKQLTVATPIVTNGLVLNLDASRTSSYPNAGTTWTDISGNGNNGTMVNGPIFGTASGGQITFDGVNDYVEMGTITSLNLINISISVWVKPTTITDYIPVIGRYHNTTTYNGWELYYFKSTNKFYFGGRESSSTYLQLMSNNTYSINNWYNITGVKSGNVWSLYVNGVLDNSLTLGSGTIAFGTNSIQIGGLITSGASYYGKSDISQSIIYNRALSQSEITQNFNATKSRFGL